MTNPTPSNTDVEIDEILHKLDVDMHTNITNGRNNLRAIDKAKAALLALVREARIDELNGVVSDLIEYGLQKVSPISMDIIIDRITELQGKGGEGL